MPTRKALQYFPKPKTSRKSSRKSSRKTSRKSSRKTSRKGSRKTSSKDKSIKTAWEMLGVPKNTSDFKKVEKAYRKKAMMYHPDKCPRKLGWSAEKCERYTKVLNKAKEMAKENPTLTNKLPSAYALHTPQKETSGIQQQMFSQPTSRFFIPITTLRYYIIGLLLVHLTVTWITSSNIPQNMRAASQMHNLNLLIILALNSLFVWQTYHFYWHQKQIIYMAIYCFASIVLVMQATTSNSQKMRQIYSLYLIFILAFLGAFSLNI